MQREAWAKRRYPAHFINKLTDADGENDETDTWLDFALSYGHLNPTDYRRLTGSCKEIGKMLGAMLLSPKSFIKRDNYYVFF